MMPVDSFREPVMGPWTLAIIRQGRRAAGFPPEFSVLSGKKPGYWLAGEIHTAVDWASLLPALFEERFEVLRDLAGTFALAAQDPERDEILLLTDFTAVYPLFFLELPWGWIASTDLAPVCRWGKEPFFDETWLWEFLYFNYPVRGRTFLRSVRRLGPATLLRINRKSCSVVECRWAPLLRAREPLLDDAESKDRALEIFRRRIPLYFQGDYRFAVSITSGFDSRTTLAFMPEELSQQVLTYTYGVEGCHDVLGGREVARRLRLCHRTIVFDTEFEAALPSLFWRTVLNSDGCERVLRSTLEWVYSNLVANEGIQAVATGVSGDHLFRDHIRGKGNVPSIISAAMMENFYWGRDCIDTVFLRNAFGPSAARVEEYLRSDLASLRECYGEFSDPQTYIRYLVYEVAPRYFGSEAALARKHCIYRSPYWDRQILQLSFEVSLGTLGFSRSIPGKDKYRECVLQAYSIVHQPGMKDVLIHGVSPCAFGRDIRFLFKLEHALRRGPAKLSEKLSPRPSIPVEDWTGWWHRCLHTPLSKFLSGDSRLAEYLQPEFLRETLEGEDLHWIGKLVTAEILLRLLENGWDLPLDIEEEN